MTIHQNKTNNTLTLTIEGWLDATTSPELGDVIESNLDGVTELILDFAALEYLSSAGLRVLLTAQQIMQDQGEMVILNVNEEIMEVFDMTGFTDILTIQ